MRIAIATQDLARIDAHFGWARYLMIYDVSAEGYHHLRTVTFRKSAPDCGSAKLAPRLKALSGCALVFVTDVGSEGERLLACKRIAPVRQFAGQPVAAALDALQQNFRHNAPPWLRREQQRAQRRA